MAVQVAVCGPSVCSTREAADARAVGALLAERGVVVICGGGPGVMTAVADGATEHGGVVVGIRPDSYAPAASPHLTAAVWTNMGEARNAIIVNSADAVIAIGCSWGTLSEIALAVRRGGVTVVTLGGWTILDSDGVAVPGPIAATSPDDAVSLALANSPIRMHQS
jgi:uncharacterized protein (TIGR00725 family)